MKTLPHGFQRATNKTNFLYGSSDSRTRALRPEIWSHCMNRIFYTKEWIMGDKGGKKDKDKQQKQKAHKEADKKKEKQDKQVKKV
jgi:hypothetical protein